MMGRCVAKLNDVYFLWSSVAESPLTYGLTREELKSYFVGNAAKHAEAQFNEMADDAENNGTSWQGYSVSDLIDGNRIGEWGDNPIVTTESELYEYLKGGE